MKKFNELTKKEQKIVCAIEDVFLLHPVERGEFINSLGFLLNKYNPKRNKPLLKKVKQ